MHVSLGLPTHRVDLGDEFISVDAITAMATTAEAAGFDAVFTSDHPAPPTEWLAKGGHHTLDPFVVLSIAAAATSTLRLHTNLFVPAYRPALIGAKQIASLDRVSGGRVIAGVGAGYVEGEFTALGATFADRNNRLDEAIHTMRLAWSGAPVGDVVQLPAPVNPKGPPIWIGGNSKRAMRRALELGDGWVPMPSPRRAARLLRTPGIESIADLAARISDLASMRSELAAAPAPFDIAFMPAGLDMFNQAAPEPAAVRDEIDQLRAIGVTWATVMLPGETLSAQLRSIEEFGARVISPAS